MNALKFLLVMLMLGNGISVAWENDQPLTYNRIELSASARDEVENGKREAQICLLSRHPPLNPERKRCRSI